MTLEALKWTALALMVLDHTAHVFGWPEAWRAPGRLVFPVLAALMGYHLHRGAPPDKYLRRLLPFALLAQPAYALALGGGVFPLNILFSLASGALLVRGDLPLALAISLLSEMPTAALVIWAFARGLPLLGTAVALATFWAMGWSLPFLLLYLLGFGAWWLASRLPPGRRLPWWAAYAFYPAHLALLGGLKRLLERL